MEPIANSHQSKPDGCGKCAQCRCAHGHSQHGEPAAGASGQAAPGTPAAELSVKTASHDAR